MKVRKLSRHDSLTEDGQQPVHPSGEVLEGSPRGVLKVQPFDHDLGWVVPFDKAVGDPVDLVRGVLPEGMNQPVIPGALYLD
jgi:hypothetical protein